MSENNNKAIDFTSELSEVISRVPNSEKAGIALFNLVDSLSNSTNAEIVSNATQFLKNYGSQSFFGTIYSYSMIATNALGIGTNAYSLLKKFDAKNPEHLKALISNFADAIKNNPSQAPMFKGFLQAMTEKSSSLETEKLKAQIIPIPKDASKDEIQKIEESNSNIYKEMGLLTSFLAAYGKVITPEVTNLIKSLVDYPDALKGISAPLLDYINAPEGSREKGVHLKSFIGECVKALASDELKGKTTEGFTDKFFEELKNLDVIGNDAKKYIGLIASIAKRQGNEFKEFAGHLIENRDTLVQVMDHVMDYVNSPSELAGHAFDTMIRSIAKVVTPESLTILVPLINKELVDDLRTTGIISPVISNKEKKLAAQKVANEQSEQESITINESPQSKSSKSIIESLKGASLRGAAHKFNKIIGISNHSISGKEQTIASGDSTPFTSANTSPSNSTRSSPASSPLTIPDSNEDFDNISTPRSRTSSTNTDDSHTTEQNSPIVSEFLKAFVATDANLKPLQDAVKSNEKGIAEAFDSFRENSAGVGEYVKDANVKGKEIATMLPKLFTSSGVEKLDAVVTNPNVSNITSLTSEIGINGSFIARKLGNFIDSSIRGLVKHATHSAYKKSLKISDMFTKTNNTHVNKPTPTLTKESRSSQLSH